MIDLKALYLGCRQFDAKGKTFKLATFAVDGVGSFDCFVSDNIYDLLVGSFDFASPCNLHFEPVVNDKKLSLRLNNVSYVK